MSELPYLWFYPKTWESGNATDSEFAVADNMGRLWTDFAKNGELPFPRAEEEMNYIEIDDLLTVNSNWRAKADDLYNKQFPEYLGEFPPFNIPTDSWDKLNDLGSKVITKWNSMKCPTSTTAGTESTTTIFV
ncbi:hypothetical protein PENTCL1PPCAC_8428 [Pristionchus entomophagus]|uniref:Esterase n=1 Tax=Pristionchus entomophagus TaxID=358040 RepID=A0AAV5SSY3_9BILA|nr:hypothetical protein PENTCL1PPCAC_8428 [Pristionchus entomophagus]